MTEIRNSDGTFAPAEPLVGQAAVEEAQGYRPMPEPPTATEPTGSTIEEEVQRLKEKSPELPQETIEIAYRSADGEIVDKNETVPLERVVKDNSDYHASQRETAERHLSAEFRAEVLKQRAELVAAAPETAEQLGIDANDTITKAIEANPELVADQPAEATRLETATRPDDGTVSPETRKAIETNPELRQYLESNASETDRAVEAFKAGVTGAQSFGQAALLAVAPELAQVPVERWAEAVQILSSQNPARAGQLTQLFANVAALNERQQLVEHYQNDQRRTQFETYVKGQDAQAKELAKKEGINLDYSKLYSYWEGMGVSRQQLAEMYRSNPATTSAEAQITQMKAALYDEIMRAPKAHPTRETVPVTRPGTAAHRASGDNSSTVRSLQRQLDSAPSQQQAIRIASRLLAAKRAG